MAIKRVLVRVERRNGKDNHSSPFLRGCVPDLGTLRCSDPDEFLKEAPKRFAALARIRGRGRKVDPNCPHVDTKRDMFLPIEIQV